MQQSFDNIQLQYLPEKEERGPRSCNMAPICTDREHSATKASQLAKDASKQACLAKDTRTPKTYGDLVLGSRTLSNRHRRA